MTSGHVDMQAQAEEAVAAVRRRSGERPGLAIVLGSGLGALADEVENAVSISYADIPHFPVSTAPGHAGRLVMGAFQGQSVAMMSGRVHLYEGYTAQQVIFPIRMLHGLGVERLVVTNAAGGVNPGFHPGSLMLITDHINLTGRNPLVGPNDPLLGPRFPDMSEPYDRRLRDLARAAARDRGIELVEGVYLGLLGPAYETPAEIRMVRTLGGDAVGMSTVTEVIGANHLGMQVLGISCITNMAAGMLPQKLNHEEVMATAARVAGTFSELLRGFVSRAGSA